jgi:7-cyano-7-deazaguanine tRNA-ribosyltransferase
VLFYPEQDIKPFYSTISYNKLVKEYVKFQICSYSVFLGIIPVELCDIYPAAHNLTNEPHSNDGDGTDKLHNGIIRSFNAFLDFNDFKEVIIYANKAFRTSLERSPLSHSNIVVLEYEDDNR